MKLVKKLIVAALIGGVALDVGAGFYFFDVAVVRQPPVAVLEPPPNGDDFSLVKFKFERSALQWVNAQPFQDVETTSKDGLKLHGYVLPASQETRNTVILVHGYRKDGKTDMGKFARFYHETLGYNVLVVDDRAHGKSEGTFIGFGYLDHEDVLNWIDFMVKRQGSDAKIVLHGLSMGAAAVLMDGDRTLPANVKAIVADSAYTDAATELGEQLDAQYNLPSFPILPTTSLITFLRAGYFFGEANPLRAVGKSTLPTLFIHGGDDDFVPTSMVYTLYDNCVGEKALLIVPHARHADAFIVAPQLYGSTLSAFLTKHMDEHHDAAG